MKMKRILVECYCEEKNGECYPCNNTFEIGIECLHCPKASFAKCPYEISFTNSEGVIAKLDDFIGFGGDMEPKEFELREKYLNSWSEICRKKINEAYEEYMEKIKNEF